MIREIVEETGVPSSKIHDLLLLGLSKRTKDYRPSLIFCAKTSLTSTQVEECYKKESPVDQYESNGMILETIERVASMKHLMPPCHRSAIDLFSFFLSFYNNNNNNLNNNNLNNNNNNNNNQQQQQLAKITT